MSEGILVWYSQPSKVQFTRGGVVAEPKILEFYIPDQCILFIHGVSGAKSGTVNTVVTVPCATPLRHMERDTHLFTTRTSTAAERGKTAQRKRKPLRSRRKSVYEEQGVVTENGLGTTP